MKNFIFLILFIFSGFITKSMNCLKDSTQLSIGISLNYFTNSENPLCLEFKPNKSSNNIFGIGTGKTFYYIRQFPKLQKNIIAGVPVALNRRNFGQIDGSITDIYNFIQIAPLIGLQFEIGKKKFLRFRATYTPINFVWLRDENKTIIYNRYYNFCGLGFTFHY